MRINLNLHLLHPHQVNRTEASRDALIHVVRVEIRSLTLLLHIMSHAYGDTQSV